MRRYLGPDQQRRVEEFVRRKGEQCNLCGTVDLQCDNSATTYFGGGVTVRLICTNAGDRAHMGGLGLLRNYSITADEAQHIGLN
jgi:hypothetical protein